MLSAVTDSALTQYSRLHLSELKPMHVESTEACKQHGEI